ncbi:hypothetical protein VTK26DRAFT_2906 [Humicola hyalothermophila]
MTVFPLAQVVVSGRAALRTGSCSTESTSVLHSCGWSRSRKVTTGQHCSSLANGPHWLVGKYFVPEYSSRWAGQLVCSIGWQAIGESRGLPLRKGISWASRADILVPMAQTCHASRSDGEFYPARGWVVGGSSSSECSDSAVLSSFPKKRYWNPTILNTLLAKSLCGPAEMLVSNLRGDSYDQVPSYSFGQQQKAAQMSALLKHLNRLTTLGLGRVR